MSEVPELSERDLEQELAHIHRIKHRTLTTALYGRSAEREVRVPIADQLRLFTASPARCELDVRRALASKEPDRELLILIDYDADRLPADLQGRLANGRVYRVDRSRRLARLFGASAVSSELLSNRALSELLLDVSRPMPAGLFSGSTVDLNTAWRWLLFQMTGYPHAGELSAERLLEHSVLHGVPEVVKTKLGPASPAGKDWVSYLKKTAGKVAPVLWNAWLSGRAHDAAALAFVLEVGATSLKDNAALRATLVMRLQSLDAALTDAPHRDPELLLQWGELAERLWRRLDTEPTDAKRDAVRAILELAAELVPDREAAQALAESKYLPIAYELTQERLAQALGAAAKDPNPQRLGDARFLLERLELHKRADFDLARRARMALRLLAYLGARPELEVAFSAHSGSHGKAFALANHYVVHGGFVDFARERARGTTKTDVEQAIEAVLVRADELREQDDESFARAYAGWVTSGSPSSEHVVPIHKGLDRFAAEFLKDRPARRLLVLLLDGMSWSNAVELLQSVELEGFAPLRYHGGKLTPMLAALPSLTGVSRSALFAGKPVKAGETLDTGKDGERFASHPGLRKVGLENARLFLKDEVATQSGDLNSKVFELVHSTDRIVGVVVNAIDDQLKGAKQVRVQADLEHIKPLRRLLKEATRNNRAILLIADHGHIRTDRTQSVGRVGDGKRYRYVLEGEPPQPYEVLISRDQAYVEKGKANVALLFRDRDAYGPTPTTGEHGGISLAEIVTPALLIGSDELRRSVEVAEGSDDPELEIAPFQRPDWWELQATAKPKPRSKLPSGSMKAVKSPPTTKQVSLPFVAAPEPAEPSSVWLERLKVSKAFGSRSAAELKRFREVVAPRVALLADAGGALPADHFARKALVLPRNVGGAVSEMQEWVNFDGYFIVEHDPLAKRVTLKLDLLEQYLNEAG